MLSDRGESQLEPTVMLLTDVLEDIARGRLRVPNFQRPFVWRPEQMVDLFDSIEKGFPIGSILLWETTEPVSSLDRVGEVPVAPAPTDRPVAYVLDGHQRLSTLFGVLRRQGRPPRADDQTEWKWRIYRDLQPRSENERYRHHRAEGSPPMPVPQRYMPVRAVSSTMDFLRFSRNLELETRDGDLVVKLVNEADRVAQRIRSYKIALIRLRGGELGEAVEVYTRLNRRGTRMDADQVVSALTHRSDQPTLGQQIDDIMESVASTDFGKLPRLALFRAVLAMAGEPDVMSPRWEKIAERMQNRIADTLPAANEAVHRTVEFLKWARMPLANLLPYAHQFVVLSTFFYHRPKPSGDQQIELERWFWVTSWAGSFAGANSTRLREALDEMRAFAAGEQIRLRLDIKNVQPMPETFNLNSARTLAYVAWEAHEFPKRLDALGQEFDVVRQLAAGAPQAYRQIVPRNSLAANRLILPTSPGVTPLAALKAMDAALLNHDGGPHSYAGAQRLLASHGIPEPAWHRLLEDRPDLFLQQRTEFLQGRLRAFAKELNVPLNSDMTGVADYDTDHE